MTEQQIKLTTAITRRIKEAEKFWNQACNDYVDLDEFLSSLNALIQALRNITFILQSNKECISDFDQWYEDQRIIMRENKLLKWLHDARTTVVHQADLKLNSTAQVSIVNWVDNILGEFDVDPLTKTEDIIIGLPSELVKEIIKKSREPALKIERRWVADSLPQYEILNALAGCYLDIKGIIKSAYQKAGVDHQSTEAMLNCEKNSFILAKKVPDQNRAVFVDLKSGSRLKFISAPLDTTKEIRDKNAKCYGRKEDIPMISGKRSDPFSCLDAFFAIAKKTLEVDGFHNPMIHLFTDNEGMESIGIPTEDKTQQYLMMRRIADVIHEKNKKGAILITEEWISTAKYSEKEKIWPADDPNKLEALGVTAIRNDGEYETRIQIFHKDVNGKIIFDDLEVSRNLSNAFWLRPILEAWNIPMK